MCVLFAKRQQGFLNRGGRADTMLMKAGANIKARDNDGWTALMYSAKYNQSPELITALRKAGSVVWCHDCFRGPYPPPGLDPAALN